MKKTMSSQLGLYSTENPWIRYVDPLGENANDGRTPATAWSSLSYALSQRPKICNMAVIKLSQGNFVGNFEIEDGLGGLIIAGTMVNTYTSITAVSYTIPGVNTVEGYPELVVDYSGQAGWQSNDTLLDRYVEFLSNETPARLYRMKIIDYLDLGGNQCRLYLSGPAEAPSINAVDPQLVVVSHGTTISGSITAQADKATISIVGNNDAFLDDNTYSSLWSRGPCLYGLKISMAVHNGTALMLQAGACMSHGPIMIYSGDGMGCYLAGHVQAWDHLGRVSTEVGTIIDPKFYSGPAFAYKGNCPSITISKQPSPSFPATFNGSDIWTAFYDMNTGGTCQIYGSNGSKTGFDVFFKAGGPIMVGEGASVAFHGRTTWGSCLYTERKYGTRCLISQSLAAEAPTNAVVGFRQDPSTYYGRIYLTGAEMVLDGSLSCGDVTKPTLVVPIISIINESVLKCKQINIGSVGHECVTANEVIRLMGNSILHASGGISIYHNAAASQPTLFIDDNSTLLQDKSDTAINVTTKTPVNSPEGVIMVQGQSRMHVLGSVNITHTDGVADGHALVDIESEVYIEGDYTSHTALTGYDLLAYEARLKIEGAIEMDTDGSCMWLFGANTRGRFGGGITVTSCGASPPIILVEHAAQVVHYGDIKIKTQDYGLSGFIQYHDLARVSWLSTVSDGDATWNRNTNAGAGWAVSIKRGSQLTCAQNDEGPDASGVGANELHLGATGLSAWPASGATLTDLTNAGDDRARQICAVHCR